jgi:hypothetical protein
MASRPRQGSAGSDFRLIERLHWILLALSLITLIGAVLGSHGMLIIE